MNKRIEEHRDESGKWHRIGGPARVYSNGNMLWLRHGKAHRRGGPADIWRVRGEFWYINHHRLHAPKVLPKAAHALMELFL